QKASVRELLYDVFSKRNYNVKSVFKVFKNHYAPLVIELEENKLLAIEFIDKRTSKNVLDNLSKKYKEANIKMQWIFLTDRDLIALSGQAYYSYLYALENSKKQEVIIINLNENEPEKSTVEIHKKYQPVFSSTEKTFKCRKDDIYSLYLQDSVVSVEGFSTFFKKQTEEKSRERKPINRNSPKSKIPASKYTKEEYSKQLEYVLQKYKDANDNVSFIDQNDNIWLTCNECGTFEFQTHFEIINENAQTEKNKYTFPNSSRLGICKECSKK
ncbi:MAG: hypothetical protein U0O22_02775, partial [Acutalibacteraceae bacterium]